MRRAAGGYGGFLIDRIESEARGNAKLRRLVGGVGWSTSDRPRPTASRSRR